MTGEVCPLRTEHAEARYRLGLGPKPTQPLGHVWKSREFTYRARLDPDAQGYQIINGTATVRCSWCWKEQER